MRGRRRLSLAVAALAVGVAVGAGALVLYEIGFFGRLELATVDARFAVRVDPAKARDVVIVGVDAQTLNDLDVRPPLPRRLHARVLERLRADRPRAIGYDVQFTERTDTFDDNRLIRAIQASTPTVPVVLATADVGPGGSTAVLGGDKTVRMVGATTGSATVTADSDGFIRRTLYSDRGLKSFSLAVVEAARRRPIARAGYPADGQWIDYAGKPGTVREVSFSDVYHGKVPARLLRGKIVVVGGTAATFQDLHPAGTSGWLPMTGPELQANAIQSLLRGSPLRKPAGIVSAGWILLWSLVGALGPLPLQRASRRWLRAALLGAAILFGLFGVLIAALALTFRAGWILPASYAGVGFVVSAFIASSLALARTRSEIVRNRFSRFVPEQAVDTVMAMSGQRRLAPAEIDATVMFVDMRGFSSHTEQRSARETIETLNRYLTIMSDGLLAHGATVVSYMGDGIMAVFGAPLVQDDHADRALEAARELLGPRLDAFNRWLDERAADWTAAIGVGIHSGPVASGMVGSERRLEYAAVGDTTNTAARLESATKRLDVTLLLSQATRSRLTRPAQGLTEVGTIAVKGRVQQVQVWTLREVAPSVAQSVADPVEQVQRG